MNIRSNQVKRLIMKNIIPISSDIVDKHHTILRNHNVYKKYLIYTAAQNIEEEIKCNNRKK